MITHRSLRHIFSNAQHASQLRTLAALRLHSLPRSVRNFGYVSFWCPSACVAALSRALGHAAGVNSHAASNAAAGRPVSFRTYTSTSHFLHIRTPGPDVHKVIIGAAADVAQAAPIVSRDGSQLDVESNGARASRAGHDTRVPDKEEAAPTVGAGSEFVDPSSYGLYAKDLPALEAEMPKDEAFRRQQQIQEALRKEAMRKFLRQFLLAFGFVLTAHAFLFVMAKKQGVFDLEKVRDSDGKVVQVFPASTARQIAAVQQGSKGSNGTASAVAQSDSESGSARSSKSTTSSLVATQTATTATAPTQQSTTSSVVSHPHSQSPSLTSPTTSTTTTKATTNINSAHTGKKQTWGEYLWSWVPFIGSSSGKRSDTGVATSTNIEVPSQVQVEASNRTTIGNAPAAASDPTSKDQQGPTDAAFDEFKRAAVEALAAESLAESNPALRAKRGSANEPHVIYVQAPTYAVTRHDLSIAAEDDDDDDDVPLSTLRPAGAAASR